MSTISMTGGFGLGGRATRVAPAAIPAARHLAPSVDWAPVDTGLWVARDADGFVGTVEEIDGRFVALDRFGLEVGRTDELREAQALAASPLGRGYSRRRRDDALATRLAVITAAVAGSSSVVIAALLVIMAAQ